MAELFSDEVYPAIVLQLIVCGAFVCFMVRYATFHDGPGKRFIHIGPSSQYVNINIGGACIDTWQKWVVLMVILVLLECVNTYTCKIFKIWYTRNVINNYGSGDSAHDAWTRMVAVTVWRFVTFVPATFKWITAISTQQLQFLIPSLLVRTGVQNMMDYRRMTERSDFCI